MTRTLARKIIARINANYKAGISPVLLNPRARGGAHQPSAEGQAFKAFGEDHANISRRMAMIKRQFGFAPDPKLYKEAAAPPAERQAKADETAKLRADLKTALREVNAGNTLRQEVFRLVEKPLGPPAWTIKPRDPRKDAPSTPVLFTSDFQWGEQIRASELGGFNEFNLVTAERRYVKLIEKTIELSFKHMVRPHYDGLVYLRGGDMISGDIHQELRETNEASSIPAVRDLVEKEIWGITQIAEKFGRVVVYSVPGNHGRTTIKPMAKRFVEASYDTLSAHMLEQWFAAKGDKRVTFVTPDSGDVIFKVAGYTCLLTHGDRIGSRGGEGFIGPVATIARGMRKLIEYYATLGVHIDYIFVGHFHSPFDFGYGWSNGCMPGYSEFAKDHRMRITRPEQWLIFFHPDHGATARWPIHLEKKPTL